MKLSTLAEKQRGSALVKWLIVILIVVALAGAAIVYLPKLRAPEPKVKRSIVTSKITAVPVESKTQKIKPPEQADTQSSTETTSAQGDTNASMMETKTDEVAGDHASTVAGTSSPQTVEKYAGKDAGAKSSDESEGQPESRVAESSDDTMRVPVAPTRATDNKVKKIAVANPAKPTPINARPTMQTPATPVPAPVATPLPEKTVPTPAPTPKKTVSARSPGSPMPYTIQFGAFRTKAYADELVANLEERGYEPYIEEIVDADNRPMYLVRMGQYDTRAEVAESVAEFKEKEHMTAVIAVSKRR